jgi:sodium-dependent dicarboxylate transporter 2/3/5
VTGARDATILGLAVASALAVGVGVGVAVGPVAARSPAAGYALGVMISAALLWLTGATPLSLTALAIPVLLVAFGVVPTFGDAVTGFADPVIFLLLAGFVLAIVGAVAASYGFALPVATPPNAVAYGAGYMDREDMLRAGLPLDVVVILLATATLTLLVRFVWPVVL